MRKLRIIVQFSLMAAAVCLFAAYLIMQSPNFTRIASERSRYAAELDEQRRAAAALERELSYAETDAFVEKMARELHGMIRRDEFIFVLDN